MQVLLDVAVNTSAIVNIAVFVVWIAWDVEECDSICRALVVVVLELYRSTRLHSGRFGTGCEMPQLLASCSRCRETAFGLLIRSRERDCKIPKT